MAEPILKWAGGKRQLLDDLKLRFPKNFNRYHEPFIGGGALFFDIAPENATINDVNKRLINFYKQVKEHPNELLKILNSFTHPRSAPDPHRPFHDKNRKGKIIKEYYYQQREIFNNRPNNEDFDPIEEAALLLYLNRTGYNGLYRENASGEFNVPIGSYKNPDWIREKQIRIVSEVCQKVDIFNTDFEYILEVAKPGDLIYFDPPYEPMSPTASFNDYSAAGFGMQDQIRLLEVAKKLHDSGVYIIMSNSGVMYNKYKEYGFGVEIVGAKRAINSNASKRGEVDEIIASNINYGSKEKSEPDMPKISKKTDLMDYF